MRNLTAIFCFVVIISTSVFSVNAQYVCRREANPIMIQGSINAGDVQQAGRISRDGSPSNCAGGSFAFENNDPLRRDSHNFTNPFNETVCVRVEMDFTGCAGNQVQSAAYSNFNPANPAVGVIGDSGYSTINKGSYSFSVGPNSNFTVVAHEVESNTGCPLYKLKITYLRNCRQAGFDRTNDGKADVTVYRPSSVSNWYSIDSETNEIITRSFGTVGDIVTGAGDFTGDGKTDLSVYRPSTSNYIYGTSQDTPGQNFAAVAWGTTGDRGVTGDFDGDGLNDVAVWRPSAGDFYVLRSGDGSFQAMHWGQNNDNPVFGDFDGDTLTDFAVVRQTSGGSVWYILKSNYNYGFNQVTQWGLPTDKLVPGDYDGDSITDLAVWRPSNGTFYIRRSSNLALQAYKWGQEGDIPQPADYDGDKIQDYAVWRPSNGVWYIFNSDTGTFRVNNWGKQGDQPIAAAYRIQ